MFLSPAEWKSAQSALGKEIRSKGIALNITCMTHEDAIKHVDTLYPSKDAAIAFIRRVLPEASSQVAVRQSSGQ